MVASTHPNKVHVVNIKHQKSNTHVIYLSYHEEIQSLDLFKQFHDVQIILTVPQELNGDGHN